MKTFVTTLIFTALLAFTPAVLQAGSIERDVKQHARQTVVQLVGEVSESEVLEGEDKEDGFTQKWAGYCSAVKISPHYLVTAAHCVTPIEGAGTVEDQPVWGTVYYRDSASEAVGEGEVVKYNKTQDLALIRVITSCPCAPVAQMQPSVDHVVFAIGFPLPDLIGNLQILTEGTYQGHLTNEPQWDSITAPMIFGNSGGGIFNERGELIGIASAVAGVPDFVWHPIPHLAFMTAYQNTKEFLNGI